MATIYDNKMTVDDHTDEHTPIVADKTDDNDIRQAIDPIAKWLAAIDVSIVEDLRPRSCSTPEPSTPVHENRPDDSCPSSPCSTLQDRIFDDDDPSPSTPFSPATSYSRSSTEGIGCRKLLFPPREAAIGLGLPPATRRSDERYETQPQIRTPRVSQQPTEAEDTARLVWITSCLQCTLKGLRCNKALPSCARCLRSKESGCCLPQFVPRNDSWTTPMLLTFTFDDEQTIMELKEQQQALLDGYRAKLDRGNWILPNPLQATKRGSRIGRKVDGSAVLVRPKPSMHPGRGVGAEVLAEVRLSEEARQEEMRARYSWLPS